MKGRRLHLFVWYFLKPLCRLFVTLKFNFRPRIHPIGGPCLVVSNHCTDYDPILLGVTVRDQCYFIASEHIFRGGLGGRLLERLQAPIVRLKGETAGDTALTAIRRMRKGYNVAVFAEGNRSYNGQTGAIIESTAKLARASGASLVTHRFRGGYLSSPRWAGDSCRRGRLESEVVNVYPPETLKAMTPAEIADVIRRDIYENAYETQRTQKIAYRGRRLAEHLERALYVCPLCGQAGHLQSRGDEFFCACGMRTRYNVYGFFEGGGLPFDNVLDWDRWQAERMLEWTRSAGPAPLASDEGIVLDEVSDGRGLQRRGCGTLRVFADRFELAGETFPFADVTGIGLSGPQSIELSCAGRHWFISCPRVCNLRKYVTFYRAACAPGEILAV